MADAELPVGGSVEHDAWSVGVGARVGAGELLFNFVWQQVDRAGDPKAKFFGIAYVQPVSKRTNFYASYGQLDNDDGADFTLRASASHRRRRNRGRGTEGVCGGHPAPLLSRAEREASTDSLWPDLAFSPAPLVQARVPGVYSGILAPA